MYNSSASIAYNRRLYAKRRNNNLCERCGKVPPRKDRATCVSCANKQHKRLTTLYKQRIDNGMCGKCGITIIQGESYCKPCGLIKSTSLKRWRNQLRNNVINAYGGLFCACTKCPYHTGIPHIRFATMDHIGGGGNKHRKTSIDMGYNGVTFYQWLKKNNYPPGYQVLCWNCNSGGNGGTCPHLSL